MQQITKPGHQRTEQPIAMVEQQEPPGRTHEVFSHPDPVECKSEAKRKADLKRKIEQIVVWAAFLTHLKPLSHQLHL